MTELGQFARALDEVCDTCNEDGSEIADQECPRSPRDCGHHCNHSWSHDECHWCGRAWGADDELRQKVIHLPSGRKGSVALPVGDRALVEWDGGHQSLANHDELRTLPLGGRV